MLPILALVIEVLVVICAVAVAIVVPLFFGLLAYDMVETRKVAPVEEKEARRRVTVERGTARAFVVAGGVFWSIASIGGLYTFQTTGVNTALLAAFFPLVACLATLVVGWYYERITSALLAAGAVGVVAWGLIYQFDGGAWLLTSLALVAPMIVASVLFWLARVDQDTYELANEVRLELHPACAARSCLQTARVAA